MWSPPKLSMMSTSEYPFTPLSFEVRPGIRMAYLDEGPQDAPVILMLHGNPSWSFLWRRWILGLRDQYRCIAPDHVGMGNSDKPDDTHYTYTLDSRIDDVEALLAHLGITGPLTLAVHDWGGGIGFGWAMRYPAQVARLLITNTGAFPLPKAKRLPRSLWLGRDTWLGAFLIRGLNAFARGTAHIGSVRRLPADVFRGFIAPYNSWANRRSVLRFVQDIPLGKGDRAWDTIERMGAFLPSLADRPALIFWGLKDFVFDRHFLQGFRDALPNAQVHAYQDAAHYVLEDKAEVSLPLVRQFLAANPVESAA